MANERWAVTTWNLQGSEPTDVDAIARHLGDTDADVIALQEVRPRQADGLASRLGMRCHWVFKHHALTPFLDHRAEGAALLTPHRLVDPSHTVISRTTSRRSFRRRIAVEGLVERDDATTLHVVNIHLSPHDMDAERRHEVLAVAALVDASDDSPTVIAGDFNDHHQPEVIAALPGDEHLAAPPTNPSEAPRLALDHVLLPAQASEVSVTVPGGGPDWAELSDHLPVTVRFAF